MDEKYRAKILTFYRRHKRMPTYAEIMKLVGFKSKNAVYKLVGRLKKVGFLSQDGSGRLIPEKIFGQIRVLGSVEAGFPSPAEEELADTVSLDDYLINRKESTYMLRVKGDSMKDAGILEGDLVLVERNQSPQPDEIVIARVDGDWTIKYLRRSKDGFFLEPANKKYRSIFPHEELNIVAVVKGVIRRYAK
ncbi:transcriptional repressor LexA [Patescibacteria group bacterium]|nr:transcriptional repressor LexA [Patescibacteria group bacterium]